MSSFGNDDAVIQKRTGLGASSCLALLMLGCSGSISSAVELGDGGQSSGPKQTTNGQVTGQEPTEGGADSMGTSTGGTSTGGSSTGATTGSVIDPPPPTPTVADCGGLGAVGVFEEITPPEVKAAGIANASDGQGTFAFAVDPVNQGTLYVGTLHQKFWKSTDCGATWKDLSKSRNGEAVASGMNWTFAIDPQNPNILYTNSGYGTNGLYKSVNGGDGWDMVWPPPSQPELAKAFQYNFANVVALDPQNHEHILLTFHEQCLPPHPATCIAESFNGGSTWTLLDGEPEWNGNEGQVIFFLENSSSWLWGSQGNGFWRTGDSGGSWQAIPGMTTSHLQGSQLVQTGDGHFYVAGADGIWTSPDGTASTWSLISDTGPIVGGLVSDGTTMFSSTCYFTNYCNPRYLTSAETDGKKWTAMNSPAMSQGGTMGFDKGHNLLYSSNLNAGLWRVVVK